VTAKTRRRLMVCFIAVALTLPIETVLLRALSSSTSQDARGWADSLSDASADSASASIQSLPFEYRKALMRKLGPGQRAKVWQSHIRGYIAQNSRLDASTQALLYNAASLATPENFGNAGADVRSEMAIVAEQVAVVLGRDTAEYLFYYIGDKDRKALASSLPISQQLAEFVRGTFIVQAAREDCDCSTQFGCDVPYHCDGNQDCIKDEEWPMCGWWWNQECNGLCMPGLG
jgi:hypothetical protein